MPAPAGPTTVIIEGCLSRMAAGDGVARREALAHAYRRLEGMAHRMLSRSGHLRRWEDADDVLQNAALRLDRALGDVTPPNARAFFGLAALQIRRELIDLARKHFGPQGQGRHHATDAVPLGDHALPRVEQAAGDTAGPAAALERGEVHAAVQHLPDELREVVDLLFYNGLSQPEAAELLGVSSRTVKRRWREARLHLAETLTPP